MKTNDSEDPLLRYRSRFPIVERTNYLISNSLGAVPTDVSESLQSYYETWAMRGVRAWEESWWEMPTRLGDLVAPLIGVSESGQVIFQPNVTIAHAVVMSALNAGKRHKIVTDAMHFPSILYLLGEQTRLGFELEIVPTDDGIAVDSNRIVDAIDDSTAAVCVSHVYFRSAFIQDVRAICQKANAVGALSVIDGYQAVGTIPVDVNAMGADIYIGGCLKWLCGGPGAAFLWAKPSVAARLLPKLTGWMAHERPFAFAPSLERRADAWRLLHGTPNIPALYAARPGLEIINEVGVAAIRAKSVRQTQQLITLAEEREFRVTAPRDADRRGGTVAIDVEPGYEISQVLISRDILCDYRPKAGIRLSPHFYTRDDELDAAIEAIGEILERRAWSSAGAAPRVVT
jgi:kynureninase